MKKIVTFAGLLCVSASMYAQSIKISGVVSDDMGPAAGATVMVKGAKTGTITDLDGRYTINAEKATSSYSHTLARKPWRKRLTATSSTFY